MSLQQRLFPFLFMGILFLSLYAQGENSQAYDFVAGQGQILFGSGGAAQIPPYVYQELKRGGLSPVIQFVLVNDLITKCVKNTLNGVPARRDPFVTANQKFSNGYCKIRKCFEQGMIVQQLSQLSSNPAYGGSSDPAERQGSQTLISALALAFNKEKGCDEGASNGGASIDPNLLQIIGN